MLGRAAEDILPFELWELVVQEFDFFPQSLLTLATICHAFNRLCIARYLLHIGVSSESLASGNIEIAGKDLLALQLSCCAPPIKRFSCTDLSDTSLLPKLKLVKKIALNSPDLAELTLAFTHDLFQDRRRDTGYSQKELLAAVCDILHAASSRTAGPVILMSEEAFFRCDAGDILQWKLHDAEAPSSIAKARRLLGRTPRVPGHSIVRDQTGHPIKIKLISSLYSVSVRSLASIPGSLQSCTLIIVNPQSADCLHLGRSSSPMSSHSLSSPELTVMLPHIILPALRRVHLDTTTMDPAALAEFLLRHPALVFLAYEPPDTDIRPPLLLSSPIAHPGLASIRVTDPIHLIPLLDSVGHSPALAEIAFRYARSSAGSAAKLTSALRRLGLHPRDTTLVLQLASTSKRVLDAEERAVAQSLQRVSRVYVDCTSVADGRALLPWLDLLPAVRRVEFRSVRGIFRWGGQHRDPHGGTLSFLEDAMEGLPRVSEVVVRENPVVTRVEGS
ncbi:hypothetical protein C8R44DRAFT_877523 [Mycena epipterygia]|nr:hypothetical protein C8R44DRAFT_877523 [Mycena epipterygia]